MKANGEKSINNTTFYVFLCGLIPQIVLYTKKRILILHGKLVVKHFLGQKLCVRGQAKHVTYILPVGDSFLSFIQYKEKFLGGLTTADYTPIKSAA